MNNLLNELLTTILNNTVEYQEVLNIFSRSIANKDLNDKVKVRVKINDQHTEALILRINTLCGKKECKKQKPSKEIISWISRSLPDARNLPEVLTCLIQAELNIEKNYNAILNNIILDSDSIILFEKHRIETMAFLNYFQKVKISLDQKQTQYPCYNLENKNM